MLRDQPEETADMKILQDMSLDVLNSETVHAYRNRHMAYRREHVWERLSDEEYLERIGVWEQQGWKQPEVIEEYGPDRTTLKLSFVKKSADKKALIKSADKKKLTNKTRQQLEKIAECMEPDREYRIAEIAEFLGVKETRTRELVRELIQLKKIEASGKNKGRRYRKIVQ